MYSSSCYSSSLEMKTVPTNSGPFYMVSFGEEKSKDILFTILKELHFTLDNNLNSCFR